jgi:hypothetical protein
VPLTANDCGLPMPLLTIVIWPLARAVAAGVNCSPCTTGRVDVSACVQVPPTIANSSALLLVTDVS